MKKILILATAVGLSALSSYGQGSINFVNSLTTVVTVSNTVTHTTSNGGTNSGTVVELLYQPGGGSAPAGIVNGSTVSLGSWEAMLGSNPFVTVGSNGRFNAGIQTTGTDVAPSGAVWLTVLGWNGGFTSLAAAEAGNAVITESTIFELNSGGGGSPPATPPVLSASTTAAGFVSGTPYNSLQTIVNPAPEPATIAIAGLSAAALLLYRRRK